MSFLKNITFYIFLLFAISELKAGSNDPKLDSLFTLIKHGANDTIKYNAHIQLIKHLAKTDSVIAKNEFNKLKHKLTNYNNDQFILSSFEKLGKVFYNSNMLNVAMTCYKTGLFLAKQKRLNSWISKFYFRIADQLTRTDEIKLSLNYYDSATSVPQIKDEAYLAKVYSLYGRSYYEQGDYKNAMDKYMLSQSLYEKNKIVNEEYGHLLHFIGSVFKRQDLFEKALENYKKELEVSKEIKNEQLEAEALYLMAGIYGGKGELETELNLELRALELFKKVNNKRMEALMLGNISSNFADRNNYSKAIYYCEQSLKIYEESGDLEQTPWIFGTLGRYYSKLGKHKKAIDYLNKALAAVENVETKQLLYRSEILQNMSFAYAGMGNYKTAFERYLEYESLEDSIHNLENKNYLSDLDKRYQTEKKEQEIILLSKDKQMSQAELAKQQTQRNALIIGCLLVIIIAGISILAFVNNRKKSNLLSKQVNEINYQNAIIKEKNKDITDSIVYAKRLQEAVFPLTNDLNKYFAESFVLFRPKDIVSGDFYWFEKIEEKTIFIVGDSTGHGVPGAFMSILGHNLLNQIILEERVIQPAEILRLLDKRVTASLNKKGSKSEYNDGMDIGVCVIDNKAKKLFYAGANRPLIVKRDESIIELKQNKFAIGGINSNDTKVFTQHEINVQLNDILYLFSDGYYDQFGGPKGKKFKFKQLQEVLLANSFKPMHEQLAILDQTFETWKGDLEQIDDVCVIGVRL